MEKQFVERREEIYLAECILGEDCRKEFAEIDKHEVISKICDLLGADPEDLNRAEKIFEYVRFEIARYVIHHEFSSEGGIKPNLLLWLDSKTNPANARKLEKFMRRFTF